jgi:hypothetical protein
LFDGQLRISGNGQFRNFGLILTHRYSNEFNINIIRLQISINLSGVRKKCLRAGLKNSPHFNVILGQIIKRIGERTRHKINRQLVFGQNRERGNH